MTAVLQRTDFCVTPVVMAEMADAAYEDEEDLQELLGDKGWRLHASFSHNETECFVAVRSVEFIPREDPETTIRHPLADSCGMNSTLRERQSPAVVAFRGTEPDKVRDWITDLDARQRRWAAFGRIHAGFFRSVDNVLADLWPVVADLARDGHALHFTGHSKGAAEATVTAARLCAANVPVAGLWTFGSPRVGDGQFAAWLDASLPFAIRRYVNNNDLVARVPLPSKWIARLVPFGWLLPAGFRHCGRLHYIDSAGHVIVDPPASQLCRDRLRGRWLAGRHWWCDGLQDHAMSKYRIALQQDE